MSVRLNLNLSDDLAKSLEERCNELSITKTAYINMAIAKQLESEKLVKNVPELMTIMQKAIEESQAQRKGKK